MIQLRALAGSRNAIVSTYSGAIVRTTHLTGMFTELGIFMGPAVRGLPIDKLRLRLCALIITAFFARGLIPRKASGIRGQA